MSAVSDRKTSFNILPPAAAGENILFRVFDNAAPIGYAKLKKSTVLDKKPQTQLHLLATEDYQSYELKMIEIAQNYRKLGVGTFLLQEIIQFCIDKKINRLTGEIKGDCRTLRLWYSKNGFQVTADDRIELLPVSSC